MPRTDSTAIGATGSAAAPCSVLSCCVDGVQLGGGLSRRPGVVTKPAEQHGHQRALPLFESRGQLRTGLDGNPQVRAQRGEDAAEFTGSDADDRVPSCASERTTRPSTLGFR